VPISLNAEMVMRSKSVLMFSLRIILKFDNIIRPSVPFSSIPNLVVSSVVS
jgi:hypothetical protein